jgi:hypothetical protein
MHFDWKGRPALMFPTVAFYLPADGTQWLRCSWLAVEAEAETVSGAEFWKRFGALDLPAFPAQFSPADRPRPWSAPPAVPSVSRPMQQQQQQPPAVRDQPEDTDDN